MTLSVKWGALLPVVKRTTIASDYAQGENIPGATLDLTKYDLDADGSPGPSLFVYLNGRLLTGGTSHDVYPGDAPDNGDVKTGLPGGVHSGDTFLSVGYW
jgi:hypothetical protein